MTPAHARSPRAVDRTGATPNRIRESHDLATPDRTDRICTTDRRFVRIRDGLGHARACAGQGRAVPAAANQP